MQGAVSEKWPVVSYARCSGGLAERQAEERNKVQDGMRAK